MIIQRKPMWELFDEHAGAYELRGIKNGLPTRTKLISSQQFPEDVSLEPMRVDFEQTAMAWDTAGYNVYAVLNSIDEDFSSTSVKDSDIEARSYMLIDIDRTETADCPASDEEVQHAIELSDQIRRFMAAQGWLEPLVVMSGNVTKTIIYMYYSIPPRQHSRSFFQ